ncbi:hypothetical protein ACOJVU_00780 [Mycobacterium sp. THU-M104]|uniref:hypothetical protein n=1 Tax=Mycobacterium sp. THU-M104 TaxID=3410515 RepID=UPI003B9A519B
MPAQDGHQRTCADAEKCCHIGDCWGFGQTFGLSDTKLVEHINPAGKLVAPLARATPSLLPGLSPQRLAVLGLTVFPIADVDVGVKKRSH